METARDAAHCGLLKLMLRLPSLRGELQILWQKHDRSLEPLCEAYEDATATLERLQKNAGADQYGLVEEYRGVCLELETDVVARCHAKMDRSRP